MICIVAGKQNIQINSQIKNAVKKSVGEIDDMNFAKYDAAEISFKDIIDEANYLPLGYDRKAVVVENCSFLLKEKGRGKKNKDLEKELKILLDYIEAPNDATDLFLTINTSESPLDKNNPIYQALSKKGQIIELDEPSEKDWPEVVAHTFKARFSDTKIDKDAVYELAKRTAGDYALLFNSAMKLSLYTDHVRYDDVILMVTRPLDEEVYNLFNFLIDNRNMDAVRLYRDLKSRNVEPVTLINNLAVQFRLLNRVSYLAKKGMNPDEIAKELALNPIRAKILRGKSFVISQKRINETLEELYQLDLNIKSGLISDRFFAFELFLINFKRN